MIENEEKIVNLLQEAKKFKIDYNVKKRNFLSITNFPRYENVISDILAFYFDTEEEHKLKDLWLNCLIECYNDKSRIKIDSNDLNVEDINREQSADERKRIDLFIVTNKDIIIIENKIDSPVKNPLGQYYEKAKSCCKEHFGYENNDEIEKHIIPILLTMKNVEPKNDKFINILYEDLINKIKEKIGLYIGEASTKWLIYMNEFIDNLEEINRGYQMSSIDPDFQQFLYSKEEEVEKFLKVLKNDINSKIDFIKEVYKKIDEKIDQKFVRGTYNCQYDKLNGDFSLYINIETETPKGTIAIEPYISRETPDIIKFIIKNRNDKNYSWDKELVALKELNYGCREEKVNDVGLRNILRVAEYRFSSGEIEVEKFAKEIIDIFEKLKGLYGKK